MTSYNGGVMSVPNWDQPVVVDLAGLKVPRQKNPALYDHDESKIVGHTTEIENTGDAVKIRGLVSGVGDDANNVRAMGRNDFPWQASLGLSVPKSAIEKVKRGRTVHVNGRNIHGPASIARKSSFREVSFVPWGADSTTTAVIAASKVEEEEMEVKNITASLGDLSEDQKAKIESVLLKAQAGDELTDDERAIFSLGAAKQPEEGSEEKVIQASEGADVQQQMLKAAAVTQRKIATVQSKFAGFEELAAKALEEDWDPGRQDAELKAAKLEKLQASRAGNQIESFNIAVKGSPEEKDCVEAAFALAAGCPPEMIVDPEKDSIDANDRADIRSSIKGIDEKTVDMALSHYGTQFGPGQMLLWLARHEGGYTGFGNGQQALKAGFSTVNTPTVFADTMNRTLLAAYRNQPLTWRSIARASSVRDFRSVHRIRAWGTGHFEPLGPGGNIKHGNIGEEVYTNKAETTAQINMLPRELFVNDDVGLFTSIGTSMAQYGALAPEIAIYNLINNDSTFFTAGNGNYLDMTTGVFDLSTLAQLYTTFRKHKSGQPKKDSRRGKPSPYPALTPRVLLVPVELEVQAWEVTNSTWAQSDGGGSTPGTRLPTANWARGQYTVVSSPYLSDTDLSGNAENFYLFASPSEAAALEVVFLNGRQRPVIESVEPKADQLGMGMRGYIDFGVAFQDHRAAAKAEATA